MNGDLAVGYIRVSTDEQAASGLGLEAQSVAIDTYCKLKGLRTLGRPLCDAGTSGGKPLGKRAEGSRLLEMTTRRNRRVEHVVLSKLDRAFRDAEDCLSVANEWLRLGVTLHIVDVGGNTLDTGTACGKFMLTMLAAAAEFERNLVGERCKAASAVLRSNGQRYSRHAPYGHRIEGDRLVRDAAEQETIARAIRLSESGLSLRAIASELGTCSRAGTVLGPKAIRRMVNGAVGAGV